MKTTKVDMSPEAITRRMLMLDQMWELAVSIKDSRLGPRVEEDSVRLASHDDNQQRLGASEENSVK